MADPKHTYISLEEFEASGRDRWSLAENEWIVHPVPHSRLDLDDRAFEGRNATVMLNARVMPGESDGPAECDRRIKESLSNLAERLANHG